MRDSSVSCSWFPAFLIGFLLYESRFFRTGVHRQGFTSFPPFRDPNTPKHRNNRSPSVRGHTRSLRWSHGCGPVLTILTCVRVERQGLVATARTTRPGRAGSFRPQHTVGRRQRACATGAGLGSNSTGQCTKERALPRLLWRRATPQARFDSRAPTAF